MIKLANSNIRRYMTSIKFQCVAMFSVIWARFSGAWLTITQWSIGAYCWWVFMVWCDFWFLDIYICIINFIHELLFQILALNELYRVEKGHKVTPSFRVYHYNVFPDTFRRHVRLVSAFVSAGLTVLLIVGVLMV